MASAKKKPPSDEESLTPPISLDGTRPVPPSGDQAVIDADNQAIIDDALAGNIKLERYNTAPGVNPANPYAGEGRDPNWKPPTEKPVVEAVGDAIVNAVPALRTWGAPEEEKPKEEPKGENVYVDPSEGRGGSSRAATARVIPAHDSDLVNPVRNRREQDAYEGIKSGYLDQRTALETQKDAEDKVAQARNAQNAAKAEGSRQVANVADQARWNVESRALDDKTAQDSFRAKMEKFSQDLADDKIEIRTTVPQQITWAIARVFGAIQQGLQHLPSNQVADQIDAHIKQSLDLQKANRAGKRERLGDMQKFYDMAAGQSKDQGERSRLAYGYAIEAAKAEADALAAASGDPLNLAEAEKIKAALDEKSAQIETAGEYGTELAAAQADIRNHKWVQASVEGGVGKPVDAKGVFFDPASGKYYAARNEKSREKLTKSGSDVLETKKAIDIYGEKLKKIGKTDKFGHAVGYDTDAMADADTAWTIVSAKLRKDTNEGTWKKSQEEQILRQLKPPSAFTGDPVSQMKIIQKTVDDLHAANMQVEAAVPVEEEPQSYGTAPKSIPTGQNYKAPKKPAPSAAGFVPAGAKARGGDVGGNQPYLVGEEGPELVVPNKPGFVLTALQTAALRGAPPTKQQAATLPPRAKSAVERYAAKMGVAREDGGAMTPEQQAADEEEARRFLGPDQGQARYERPKTAEEAQQEAARQAYEQREADRQRRIDQEAAAAAEKRRLEAEQKAQYEADWRVNPVHAWAAKLGGQYDVRTAEEQAARNKYKREKAAGLAQEKADWKRQMGYLLPKGWEDKTIEDVVGHRRILPDKSPPPRQPVSFERDSEPAGPPPPPARADGGEVLPLYEPEGKELHQSLDGHAYLASNEERPSGASLSGSSPRYSAPRAERPATPPPRKPTPEELMRMADELDRDMRAKHEARMSEGPSVRRAAGGSPETNYETELTSGAERAFKDKFRVPDEEPWERKLGVRREGEDYDLRGAFANGDTDGQRVEFSRDGTPYFPGHLPDTYKKPNHETFSTESQYAKDAPTLAGQWAGDKYVRNPQRPPEWLEQYMSEGDEDRVGSDYEDDEDALARRACGGAMQPKGLAATFAQGMNKTQRRR